MKKGSSYREPSRSSLRELPEVDFPAYAVCANPFAARSLDEGMELVVAPPTKRTGQREPGPSRRSLREVPEADFDQVRVRRNPYAERIASEGISLLAAEEISLQVGRGRPKRGDEVGPTIPRSIRLPAEVWRLLETKAKERGLPLHALLRAAVLEWLRRVA